MKDKTSCNKSLLQPLSPTEEKQQTASLKAVLTHSLVNKTANATNASTPKNFIDVITLSKSADIKKQPNFTVTYTLFQHYFGLTLIAASDKGVCFICYCDSPAHGVELLSQRFKTAIVTPKLRAISGSSHTISKVDLYLESAEKILNTVVNLPSKEPKIEKNRTRNIAIEQGKESSAKVALHLIGTNFQLKVWQALLPLKQGELSSYGAVAKLIQNEKAIQAVGSAIGNNPIAYLIPCHRVIQKNGNIGGYRWGITRKQHMLNFELSATLKV